MTGSDGECCRCLSVSYDPVRRECRLSRYDQTGSRIVYDAEHDYYENLLGKTKITTSTSAPTSPRLSCFMNCFVFEGLTEPDIKSQLVF